MPGRTGNCGEYNILMCFFHLRTSGRGDRQVSGVPRRPPFQGGKLRITRRESERGKEDAERLHAQATGEKPETRKGKGSK